MRKAVTATTLICITLIAVSGCDNNSQAVPDKSVQQLSGTDGRWYNQDQVERGNPLYQAYCAECHKPDASGTEDWRKLDENGKLPPPPLNGTAHTWHHPLSVLRRTVRNGGVPLGGTMPAFGSILNAKQIDDIFAWVQSHWSEQIYQTWVKRDMLSKQRASKSK